MTGRESGVHNNHNHTMYITKLYPLNDVFILVVYPSRILERTKGVEIKHGTYIDVDEIKCRRQEP